MSPSQNESNTQLIRKIEAILFIASDGVTVQEIASATGYPAVAVRKTLQGLSESYASEHGLEIVQLGDKWHMTTARDLSETLEAYRAADEKNTVRLTRASLETLAVIAYSQPVTRSEIEAIRGVRCDRVIDTLLAHGLARIAGRRKTTGSPLLYRTTPKFLETFGLAAIADLPTIAELEELRAGSGESGDASGTGDGDVPS